MQTPSPNGRFGNHETLVFVYGRLRMGEADHSFLNDARLVAKTETAAAFELVDLGGLPALVEGGAQSVHGEVYAVDARTLAMIDEIEDHPETFRRTRIELVDGSIVEGYVMPRSQASCFPRLAEGLWRRRA